MITRHAPKPNFLKEWNSYLDLVSKWWNYLYIFHYFLKLSFSGFSPRFRPFKSLLWQVMSPFLDCSTLRMIFVVGCSRQGRWFCPVASSSGSFLAHSCQSANNVGSGNSSVNPFQGMSAMIISADSRNVSLTSALHSHDTKHVELATEIIPTIGT